MSFDEQICAPVRVERSRVASEGGGREHQVEVQLTRDPTLGQAFSERVSPIDGLRRQLPLGLFDGEVAKAARWTPGSGAQADLWSTSPDGETFHLFELKVSGNRSVGVLPELLVYAWLLHRVRCGFDDGRQVAGGGPGAQAVRRAERIAAWIMAPSVHPLLLAGGRTPLEWVAERLGGDVDLGIVFYEDAGGAEGFGGWRPEHTWNPAHLVEN